MVRRRGVKRKEKKKSCFNISGKGRWTRHILSCAIILSLLPLALNCRFAVLGDVAAMDAVHPTYVVLAEVVEEASMFTTTATGPDTILQ